MPPRRNSRYQFCQAVKDTDGRLYLTEREPFRYKKLADNIPHPVRQGDTLWLLAGRYYRGDFSNANQLFWIIADFQPDPIIDPTLELVPGSVIVVPSPRTVREDILSEKRRDEIGA